MNYISRPIFALLLVAIYATPGVAQYYSFKASTEPYVELTEVDYAIPDNSPYWGNVLVKRDINFPAYSQKYDLNEGLYTPIEGGYVYLVNDHRSFTLYTCLTDLEPRRGTGQTSEFSFKLTEAESEGDVLKLQWKNMGLVEGTPDEYLNFQLWLYANGRIDIRFGECNASASAFEDGGPVIGLFEMDEQFSMMYEEAYLRGSSASPTFSEGSITGLSGGPVSGSVFTFELAPAHVRSNTVEQMDIYEHQGRLHIRSLDNPVTISLTNILGQQVLASEIGAAETLDISHLFAGVYHVACISNGQVIASQIVIKR